MRTVEYPKLKRKKKTHNFFFFFFWEHPLNSFNHKRFKKFLLPGKYVLDLWKNKKDFVLTKKFHSFKGKKSLLTIFIKFYLGWKMRLLN